MSDERTLSSGNPEPSTNPVDPDWEITHYNDDETCAYMHTDPLPDKSSTN